MRVERPVLVEHSEKGGGGPGRELEGIGHNDMRLNKVA